MVCPLMGCWGIHPSGMSFDELLGIFLNGMSFEELLRDLS